MSEPISTAVTGVAVAAGKEIAANASKGIGQTVSDMWYAIYGYKWSEKRQMKEIEVARNIEKFKEEITNKAAKIPEDNKQEPDIDIIGLTLDAAKFRINKDEIRNMFSNLIVSAMDNSKSHDIHPSFSEMIKQLSPLDAQNLYSLYHYQDETISKIIINFEHNGYRESYSHIYLANPDCKINELIAPSIENLIRLKLVDVTYSEYKTAENAYDAHFKSSLYLDLKKEIENRIKNDKSTIEILGNVSIPYVIGHDNKILSEDERLALKVKLEKNLFKDVELQKGVIQLTALGRNFCKICLSE